MLNQNSVLDYIKSGLGFPFMHLELEDDKILDYTSEHTLKEFSYYVPQKAVVPLNLNSAASKVPGIANEYYIFDPQGLEILNVIDLYTSSSELMLHGHPPLGPLSMGELQEWALAVHNSMMVKMFSSFDYTFEFKHPNIIRISPLPKSSIGYATVEYERQQPADLSGVPNDLHIFYKKMALADVLIMIGRIRKRYGNMRTPFGEIEVSADVWDEGKELKREVIEYLERLFVLNVRISHG